MEVAAAVSPTWRASPSTRRWGLYWSRRCCCWAGMWSDSVVSHISFAVWPTGWREAEHNGEDRNHAIFSVTDNIFQGRPSMAPYKAGMEGTEEAEEESASGDLIAMNRWGDPSLNRKCGHLFNKKVKKWEILFRVLADESPILVSKLVLWFPCLVKGEIR